MSRIEKRLLHEVGRAIHDFKLIEAGDRIMVAVSGGKDSLGLLHLLIKLRDRAPVPFTLIAATLDQGQPGFPVQKLREHLASTGVEYRIEAQDTYSIVKRLTPDGKTFCPVCSRLRRGILYNLAVQLGCNKLALGHHRDDLIETLLLSALYSGALKSMPPRLVSDDGRNVVIRPLAYCAEDDLREYAKEQGFPVIPCNLCSSQPNQQRRRIKQLLTDLSADHPAVRGNLFNALSHVVPSHLLDPTLATSRGAGEPEGEAE